MPATANLTIFQLTLALSQDVPKDFILEGFQAKPKGPKAPKTGEKGGGGEDASGQHGGDGQPPSPEKEKKKEQLCLLGAQAALKYGIVFSRLRYLAAAYACASLLGGMRRRKLQ